MLRDLWMCEESTIKPNLDYGALGVFSSLRISLQGEKKKRERDSRKLFHKILLQAPINEELA